jgi:hypothetical protein
VSRTHLPWVACLTVACACGGTATTRGSGSGGSGQAGTNGTGSFWGQSAGGAATTTAPMKCKLNSDCSSALVCSFGLCHSECETTRDCPSPQRCVRNAADPGISVGVCQLRSETTCVYLSDCPDPLVCAADLQCRNECAGDRDCVTGQICASGVCAEPSEINPDGTLEGASDAGLAAGLPGSSTGGSGGTP